GSRMVGVGTYDRYPPDVEKVPRLGGLLDPNIEQLIALKPDLVIVYDTQAELKRQLQRANIAFWAYSIRDLTDVTATLRGLGSRVGMAPATTAAATEIEMRLQRVRMRVSGRPRPKTLLIFGREAG